MGLITSLKESITKLFSGGKPKRIGIYGPPNAGKCLAANEQVLLSDGTQRSIKDVFESARERCPGAPDVSHEPHETWFECSNADIQVPALTADLTITSSTVSHVFRQYYSGSMYRVRTASGAQVLASPNHPFITISETDIEKTNANDISRGTCVALLSSATPSALDSSAIPNGLDRSVSGNEQLPTKPITGKLTTDNKTIDGEKNTTTNGEINRPSQASSIVAQTGGGIDVGSETGLRTADGVTWDVVVSVEETGYEGHIYDLTVPEHHTFVTADGLVVHNTTLANRIARDWTGDAVGPESHVPHETRRARRKENVEIQRNGSTVTIDIVDTPGVTTKVDYKEFLEHDMTKEDAVRRSREATEGVAEAMHWLREDVDGVVYVLDSTEDPFTQVNTMLVGIIESRDLPVLIFANKIDLDESSTQRIVNAFPQHDVVPLSALEGDNMKEVYDKIATYFG